MTRCNTSGSVVLGTLVLHRVIDHPRRCIPGKHLFPPRHPPCHHSLHFLPAQAPCIIGQYPVSLASHPIHLHSLPNVPSHYHLTGPHGSVNFDAIVGSRLVVPRAGSRKIMPRGGCGARHPDLFLKNIPRVLMTQVVSNGHLTWRGVELWSIGRPISGNADGLS